MLKAVFDIFETTEQQLTHKAVWRLRVSALLSFFVIPIATLMEVFDLSDGVVNALLPLGVLSFIAMLYCFSTRLANRLWIPEKYLDEIEIVRKRRASSVAFQVSMIAFILLFIVFFVLMQRGLNDVSLTPCGIALLFGSVFVSGISLQTSIAAFMIKPLEQADAGIVPMDGRYKWGMGIIIVLLVLGSAALGRI